MSAEAKMVKAVDPLWLPKGHHYDLHIEHAELPNAGTFTGGHPKLIWHTTESEWDSVDAMWRVLRDKDAAPHIVIGGRDGTIHPVAIQCISFDRAARALEHPAGSPETNRASCIQVEICGRAAESRGWSEHVYKALANLTVLIEHRVEIARKAGHVFGGEGQAKRLSPAGFVAARSQHLGHEHVPNNSHYDPGAFDIGRMFALCRSAPNRLS